MKNRKPESNKPISGICSATIGSKTFTLSGEFGGKEKTYTFKQSDLEDVVPEGWELKAGKEYFAYVSDDGSRLMGIRPANGSYLFKSTSFARRDDDGDFVVMKKDGDYGPYLTFIALLTVQQGKNKGIDYPLYLILGGVDKPKLVPDDDGLMATTFPDKPKGNAAMFRDYLEYTQVYETDIPFPMDGDEPDFDPQAILAALEKAIKKQKAVFRGLVEGGFPKSLAAAEDEELELDDTVSDEDEKEPVTERKAVKEEAGPYSKSKRNWDDED